jgi:hypothetical protein
MKAYIVRSEYCDEGGSAIVFGKHRITAQIEGLQRLNVWDGELVGSSCHRAPQWDEYADGTPIPVREMVYDGWWFECYCCGRRLEHDSLFDEGKDPADIVGEYNGYSFCDQSCHDWYWRDRHEKNNFKAITIDKLKAQMELALPEGIIYNDEKHHVYPQRNVSSGKWHAEQASICFKFPGAQYWSTFENIREHDKDKIEGNFGYYVPNGDLDAFDKWREKT